ncbi:uncharacterized protein LOC124802856 isoform X1 [Schistocerca piceifrons]|uniref:uncharacterized protein LOC124802856 isoform X1 n=2 Tax=Schistocerca piceifrons TaxID=274613 RepID=UPI001F5EF264|nr:uncharacterized protein LOC124802856 isoform X1 [Schistocerca piceifrons]
MLLVVYVNCIMSINVTVNANLVSVKRGKMLLTDVNELKKQELNRRRRIRIEQVRQQSKDIADHIRKRVQRKKDNVLKAAEMKENFELQNCQERKLKSLQQKYHECLHEVGLAHTHAALQPDPVSVLAAQIERISDQAKIRGKQALEKQKAENRKASETEDLLKTRKKTFRAAEDLMAAKIVAGKKTFDDRAERVPLMSTAVNVQRAPPNNIVPHRPMSTGPKKVQHARVTEHTPKDLVQLDGDTSDSFISASGSDEELLVACYEFQPTTSSRYSGKSYTVDSAADFGKVPKDSYSDFRATEQIRGRKKSPQFLELPEVIDDDDEDDDDCGGDSRETPDNQDKGSDQYFMSSDQLSSSQNPTSSLGTDSKGPIRDQQAPPEVVNSKTNDPKSDMSKISSTEQKSVFQPMISEQLTSCETASHYSRPRTVPVWQSKESRRSVLSYPSSRQVHFYDHSSRYQQQCFHPKDVVQKIDEPFQKTAVQLAEEVTVASEATQKESLKTKLHREQLQQCRSSQALARERLKRQYNLLLSELETLSRKERLARALSVTAPAIHMSEARWKERGNIRQRNMDSVFERLYYCSKEPHTEDKANTVSCLQEKISDTVCNKGKNIAVESDVKLNVGHCVPPQTAVRVPASGKVFASSQVMHSTAVSKPSEQPAFGGPLPSKESEKACQSQASDAEDLTDGANIHLEKTCPLDSKPSGIGHTHQESVATTIEAVPVSASFSSQTTSSSSSSDVSSNRGTSTNTESKILNSKHEIDVLRNKRTRQTAGNNCLVNKIILSECSDTLVTTDVSRAERKREPLKNSLEKKSQKCGPSKHYESNDEGDCKEQQNSAHSEQVLRKASETKRLKLLRSKGTEGKKMKDNFDKVKLTAFGSSTSLASDCSVLDSRERPEVNATSTDSHSSCGDVKIVVEVCDTSQELIGNRLYDTVDSEQMNRETEKRKHCKRHCWEKVPYRGVFTKELQTQPWKNKSCETRENLSCIGTCPQLESGQEQLDPTGLISRKTSRLTGNKLNVEKTHGDDTVRGNKLHDESDGTSDSDDNEEKRDTVSKELDETMNATSASTSYFSPPEKMSTARAKEIESAVDAISSFEVNTQKSDITVVDTHISVNPQLSCYIRRLLTMSRESIENLSVSISSTSIQPEEIVNCSTNRPLNNDEFENSNCRRAWVSLLSGRRADKLEILQQRALDIKQDTEQTIDICGTDVKMSHRANSSNCNDVQFTAPTATQLPDVHSQENRDSNSVELQENKNFEEGAPALQCEKVTPSGAGAVNEVNHSDLIVAMNKRIISAINEMNGTVSSLPLQSNVMGLEKAVSNTGMQNVAESTTATDIPSPKMDLSDLAEKYSQRVSDLSKKLERLRLEKQHIVEMSSSGSDREVCDETAYSNPPLKMSIVPDVKHPVISLYQPEYVQPQIAPLASVIVPTSHEECNGAIHNFRGKPPVSLNQKLIRDICTPHELSTIIEVNSPQVPQAQAASATELVTNIMEDKIIDSNTQSYIPEVSATKEKNNSSVEERPSSAEDKSLSDCGGDVVRDIMAELLERKLLTSPYHWLKDEYEKKLAEHESSVAEAALSNEDSERKNLGAKTSKDILNSSHNVTDTPEHMSFQTSSKSGNLNIEEECPFARSTSVHQTDLHNVFEKLGIGWANSMLQKTRQAMTYSSSSSENSHDFSASRKKNSLKDAKKSREEHQALKCETSKSAVIQDLLQYKKEHFVPATLSLEDVPKQKSANPENSIKSNISKTRETEISTARDESCVDECLSIKVPNISLTTKLKLSVSGSNSSS